jgi:hypothetical protein
MQVGHQAHLRMASCLIRRMAIVHFSPGEVRRNLVASRLTKQPISFGPGRRMPRPLAQCRAVFLQPQLNRCSPRNGQDDSELTHRIKFGEQHAKTCSRSSSHRRHFRRDRIARRSSLGRWLARRLGRTRYRIRPCSRRFGLWSRRCCIAVLLRTWLWILRAAILPTRTLCLLWRTSLLRPSVLSLGSACLLVKGRARFIRAFFWA